MSVIRELIQQLFTTAVVIVVLGWAGSHLLDAKIKSYFDRLSEDYKFELRIHEQGAKIAEYAALATSLKTDDDQTTYRRANQLSWELFLWLPDNVYRKLGKGLQGGTKDLIDAMVDVRKELLRNRAGNLGPDDIIVHAPNAAKVPK